MVRHSLAIVCSSLHSIVRRHAACLRRLPFRKSNKATLKRVKISLLLLWHLVQGPAGKVQTEWRRFACSELNFGFVYPREWSKSVINFINILLIFTKLYQVILSEEYFIVDLLVSLPLLYVWYVVIRPLLLILANSDNYS